MKKIFLLATLQLVFITAFTQVKYNASRDFTNAALWQQTAGEYRALCFQAYNFAKLSLKESLWEVNNNKLNCIVVDVDETVLDNSPFQGYELKKGVSFVPADWAAWTSKASADTVPGALNFLKFAASKNVEVFYLTNRVQSEHDATLKNLQAYGFPHADEKHLLLKSTTSDKEPRRQEILKNYNILMLCGDNLSDFSNVFYREGKNTKEQVNNLQALFGTKYIVLPNPMYGDWEKPLYSTDNLNEEAKGAERLQRLKSFK